MTDYKKLTQQELKQKIDKKEEFVLIDVLGEMSYQEKHIPGAVNIDVHKDDFLEKAKKQFPDKSQEIVVYCASSTCQASPRAAMLLTQAGYTNVHDYENGLAGWEEADYEFEK